MIKLFCTGTHFSCTQISHSCRVSPWRILARAGSAMQSYCFHLTAFILRINEKNESQETSSLIHLLLFLSHLRPSSSLTRQFMFQLAGALLQRGGGSLPTTVKVRNSSSLQALVGNRDAISGTWKGLKFSFIQRSQSWERHFGSSLVWWGDYCVWS